MSKSREEFLAIALKSAKYDIEELKACSEIDEKQIYEQADLIESLQATIKELTNRLDSNCE